MKVSAIPKAQTFGVRLPQNFAKDIMKNCHGFSLQEALKLEKELSTMGPDSLSISKISTEIRRPTLLGKKYTYFRLNYSIKKEDQSVIRNLYCDVLDGKKPLGAQELFEKVKSIIQRI